MVSVIIVVYNGEKYIEQAIKSVLNQTYDNIELIVVDDGSTDNTAQIIKKYKNIKYIYQKNKGQGAARNLGLANASGDYIAYLDADDLYEPNKIEEQIKILKKENDVDIVYNDLKVVDDKLNYLYTLKSEGIYDKREDLLANIIYRQVVQGPVCIILRRKCIEDIKWNENLSYAFDYDYTMSLCLKYKFKYLEKPLYIYRRHENNISNKHVVTMNEEIEIIKKLGISQIKKLVFESSFSDTNKKILLAKIYIKIGEYNEALNIFTELEKEERCQFVYFYMGLCNHMMRNIKDAIFYYKNSIKMDDNMAEAYNNLGCCIFGQDNEASKGYFNKALEIRENYMDAQNNLKSLTNSKNDIKITYRELRKVLTIYN